MFDVNRLNWPARGDINAWADFVETLCIFNKDTVLSLEDFADFLTDDASKKSKDILSAINFNENFLAPLSVATTPFKTFLTLKKDEEDEEDREDDFSGEDEYNKAKEDIRSRLITLFNFLQARKEYFKEFYPFEVSPKETIISYINRENQTMLHKLYQVLLFSSEMNLYTPGDINRIGHLFESLCKRPFYQLVPAIAEKRFFGAGGGVIIRSDYLGDLKHKIQALAGDLYINTNPDIDDPDELGSTGDAGLDWVAWVGFEDESTHQPVYFGQCACGANWVDKQHETALSRWRNFLLLNQSVQCFHFMPRSFRRTSLEWFRKTAIVHELTLIDRFRLLKMFSLEDDEIITEALAPYNDLLEESANFYFTE